MLDDNFRIHLGMYLFNKGHSKCAGYFTSSIFIQYNISKFKDRREAERFKPNNL